jgi:hypothetical protein
MNLYFCQRADSESVKFDMVNQHVYENRDKCVILCGDSESPRYTSNSFAIIDGNFHVTGVFNGDEMSKVIRLLGVKSDAGTYSNGFCVEPESVIMIERKKVVRYDLKDGAKWTRK